MTWALLLLLAASGPQFDITDARGKKPGGVAIEAGAPDADGWMELKVTGKPKSSPVLVWPCDGKVKMPDGPGPIAAVVVERGDAKILANPKVVAALAAGELLGSKVDVGVDWSAAAKTLEKAEDPFAKGVGLMYSGNASDAVEPLARALRERERVLTRVPSEIYPAAMLYGRAQVAAGKFDDAAVTFLKAMKLRPSDGVAKKARADALVKAGKPEAAEDQQ